MEQKKQRPPGEAASANRLQRRLYFIAVETLLNVVLSCVPKAWTVAMMATAIPAAINPYSIAVAPD
jgi:hypothetical protein